MDQFSQRNNLGVTMYMHFEDDLIRKRDCTSNLFSLKFNNQWYVYVWTHLFVPPILPLFLLTNLCQGTEKVGLYEGGYSATCHI